MIDSYPNTPEPEFGYEIVYAPRVIKADGDAYQQRSLDGINALVRTTTLDYKNLTTAEKETLVKFFEDHGGDQVFNWQPATDAALSVWRAHTWSYGPTQQGAWDISVGLQEEFDPEAVSV